MFILHIYLHKRGEWISYNVYCFQLCKNIPIIILTSEEKLETISTHFIGIHHIEFYVLKILQNPPDM